MHHVGGVKIPLGIPINKVCHRALALFLPKFPDLEPGVGEEKEVVLTETDPPVG